MTNISSFTVANRGVHRITRYSLPNFGPLPAKRLPAGAVVAHIDIDAFYAQVEQVDFNLRGIPLIIGAWHDVQNRARGIVATASYEARQFGIRTGMTHHQALQHCPYLVALRINYEKYRSIAAEIRRYLEKVGPQVEGYSMDEFFVLFPDSIPATQSSAASFARHLQKQIEVRFGLTVSIGVASNKSYAKLGSGLKKPSGISVLLGEDVIQTQVHPLLIQTICGIGEKRAKRLNHLGVHTIRDAFDRGKGPFQSLFGPHLGQLMWEAATGRDTSPILESESLPKEYHHLHTLPSPIRDIDKLKAEFMRSVSTVCRRLRQDAVASSKWELYLRFDDPQWEGVPIPFNLQEPSCCDTVVFQQCWQRLRPISQRFIQLGRSFLGTGITALEPNHLKQQVFHLDSPPDPIEWFRAMDECNDTIGESQVMPAPLLQTSHERVHFLEI